MKAGVRLDRGVPHLLRMLVCLPASSVEIARRIGSDEQVVSRWLWQCRLKGLVHCTHVEHVRPHVFVRHWAMGPGVNAESPNDSRRRGRSVKPVEAVVTFGLVWRALENPHTAPELAEVTGIDHRSVNKLLKQFREAKMAHISGWQPVAHSYAPEWTRGHGQTARRPAPLPRKVVNARAWQRRKEKLAALALQQALTAPMQEREAA